MKKKVIIDMTADKDGVYRLDNTDGSKKKIKVPKKNNSSNNSEVVNGFIEGLKMVSVINKHFKKLF